MYEARARLESTCQKRSVDSIENSPKEKEPLGTSAVYLLRRLDCLHTKLGLDAGRIVGGIGAIEVVPVRRAGRAARGRVLFDEVHGRDERRHAATPMASGYIRAVGRVSLGQWTTACCSDNTSAGPSARSNTKQSYLIFCCSEAGARPWAYQIIFFHLPGTIPLFRSTPPPSPRSVLNINVQQSALSRPSWRR